VTVGIARVTIFVAGSHSLKEKRSVARRVKDLVRQKFNVSIAEVGSLDVWQRAVIGLSLVGNERRFVESALDEILAFIRTKAEVLGEEKELQSFNEALAAGEPPTSTGSHSVNQRLERVAGECAPCSARCSRATRSRTRACAAPASSR